MINVIIPCYNCADTLPNTLASLVSQTSKKFFVTLVQDGPSENIDDIVEQYSNKLIIKHIKLLNNVGPGLARQEGIDRSGNCDYLLFLDSDDMLMPYTIEIFNRESQKTQADILYAPFIQHNKYGITRIIDIENANTWVHGKLYRTSFLKENNIAFSKKLRYNEDAYFNTVALNLANNIKRIDLPMVLWVDNKNSVTRSDSRFEINSIPEFILSQSEAMLELINREKTFSNDELFAKIINNIYDYYQFYIYNKMNGEEILETLKSSFNNKLLLEKFKNKSFIHSIMFYSHKEKINKFYTEQETLTQFLNNIIGGTFDADGGN